jgi:hypothetical protein
VATVREVARDAMGSVGSIDDLPFVAKAIDNRYKELVAKVPFRHLRALGELVVSAVVETGTVEITRGETDLDGSSTTWATSPGTGARTEWFVKPATAWYRLASVTDDTNIVLASAFAEDDQDGVAYDLVQRYYTLPSTVRWLGKFVHTRMRARLDFASMEEMDHLYPD